jgi:uncharacterized lipoprotein YddW (UPF0748 family)
MLALAALLTLATAAAPDAAEMRGLWVVRTALLSPETVDQAVDDAARAGFNAVFAQVRGRCDAFYRSARAPRSALLAGQPAGFDPLARLVRRAHARGLQVHAWINVLLCAPTGQPLPPGHLLRRFPGYALEPPGAEGVFLSPASAGAAAHLEAVVRELVGTYDLDGLHLDYIRYPGPGHDGPSLAGDLTPELRRETLTALVSRLASAARAERPGIAVSAAVIADEAKAVREHAQDWPEWMRRGILDAVAPMAYTADVPVFRAQVENAVARTRGSGPVWAGIGVYRLGVPGMIAHVREARRAGARGVVFFSHEWLLPADGPELRRGVFAPPPAPAAWGGGDPGGTGPR